MLFGKNINKYYIKYLPYIIVGIIALIFVDLYQLEVPEIIGQIVDDINEKTLEKRITGRRICEDCKSIYNINDEKNAKQSVETVSESLFTEIEKHKTKELDSISKVKADADSDSPSEDALIEMALYYLDKEDAEKAVAYAKKAINLHNSADGRVIYGIVSEFGLKPYKQNIQYVDSTYYNAVNAKNGPTRPRLQYVVAEYEIVENEYDLKSLMYDMINMTENQWKELDQLLKERGW